MRISFTFATTAIAMALTLLPAQAHHSFVIFDNTKTVVVAGTVKEFQWTNPHSWILMEVSNAQGKPEEWTIQLNAPGALARHGWRPKIVTPGMKISAVIHPVKHGHENWGQFVAVTLPDGKVLSDVNNPNVTNGGTK